MNDRRRPGMVAGSRYEGAGIQPLEDLADRRPFVDEPAVDRSHHGGFTLVHDKVTGHDVLARYVAVAIRGFTALVVSVAGLLQLPTPEALAENGALIFGDRALDLQQKLVVWIV